MASGRHLKVLPEKAARRGLVAYGRELWDRRLVMGSSGNASVRLGENRILVTPSARSLRNLREDELVLVDRAGHPRQPGGIPTSELPLHLAAYRVRPEVRVVLHTHPTFCVLCSKAGRAFTRDTVGARETLREVGFTPYFPAGSAGLAAVVGAMFATGVDNVLMERHGLTCIGASFEDAFLQTDLAEEAARIAYFTRLAGLSEGVPPAAP
ncbi:MAG: class II aldolase/adducin family protein [Candidatus Eremiobacteraeota bacterium]|nr:class II aldolase/adducin family protein [Candidatus Eremiobacteraeota bacterium]